ncbi:hypothetical protein JHK87_040080 [Glycine soja]|nr:hypothetical protein JHK87_040080 [Glycine soja]
MEPRKDFLGLPKLEDSRAFMFLKERDNSYKQTKITSNDANAFLFTTIKESSYIPMSRSSSKVVKIDTPYDDECNDEGSDKEDQFAFMSRKNLFKKPQEISQEKLFETLIIFFAYQSTSRENTAPSTTIITTSTTTIHTDGDPNIDIEHFFEISMLEGLNLDI